MNKNPSLRDSPPKKKLKTMDLKDNLNEINKLIEKNFNLKENFTALLSDFELELQGLQSISQSIHFTKLDDINDNIIDPIDNKIQSVLVEWIKVKDFLIENKVFNKFENIYNKQLQSLIQVLLLKYYLLNNDLGSLEFIKDSLTLNENFDITYDYLHSIISLINDLTRLTINSVIMNEFNRTLNISKFIKDLHLGLCSLNFKNDSLRKRFDSLKYDLNKVE